MSPRTWGLGLRSIECVQSQIKWGLYFVLLAGLEVIAAFFLGTASPLPAALGNDGQDAQTLEWAFIDFDGNLVNHHPHLGGTFSTLHRIFLVRDRSDFMLAPAATVTDPEYLDISSADFERLRPFFAQSENLIGPVGRKATLEDGRTITPGRYMIRSDETYQYFGESRDPNRNYLLEDFKRAEALALSRGSGSTFKGPAWDVLRSWCSTAQSAKGTRILTARRHSKKETDELNAYWIKQGYINFAPTWVSIGRPEFDRFGPTNDIAARKANYIKEGLRYLERLPKPPRGRSHFVSVSDDTQSNIEQIHEVFFDAAHRNGTEFTVAILNSGLSTEVRKSGRPRVAQISTEKKAYRSVDDEALHPPSVIKSRSVTSSLSFGTSDCGSAFRSIEP